MSIKCQHIKRIIICSVVIDIERFKKNVLNLRNGKDIVIEYHTWHNKPKQGINIPPPVFYNQVLSKYRIDSSIHPESDWILFIHDDLLFKSTVDVLFETLVRHSSKTNRIFGLLGAASDGAARKWFGSWRHRKIINSPDIVSATEVDTVDSMCLFVRGDVVLEYSSLIFDKRFNWHLYIEDFCLALKRLGVPIFVLPSIQYEHQSDGEVRFDYLFLQTILSSKVRKEERLLGRKPRQYWGTCGRIGARIGYEWGYIAYLCDLLLAIFKCVRPRNGRSYYCDGLD